MLLLIWQLQWSIRFLLTMVYIDLHAFLACYDQYIDQQHDDVDDFTSFPHDPQHYWAALQSSKHDDWIVDTIGI